MKHLGDIRGISGGRIEPVDVITFGSPCQDLSVAGKRAGLGSLFDGIGGFPLVWERIQGAGTARWASEIEKFCIKVTKYHFPEKGGTT